MEWLAGFYRDQRVALVCSLPCYTADNVDKQRGHGVFDGSIRALQRLNALGFGRPGSDLRLDLVYNPLGAFLPGRRRSWRRATARSSGGASDRVPRPLHAREHADLAVRGAAPPDGETERTWASS
jgi:hypothetical protein